MSKAQTLRLFHGNLYVYGTKFQEQNQEIPKELDSVEDICIYCKENDYSLYYWPNENILGYMEECYVRRIAKRYNLIMKAEQFFSFVNKKAEALFPEILLPPPSNEPIAVQPIRLDEFNVLGCVGTKTAIDVLQKDKSSDIIALINFLSRNNIYCCILCENEDNLITLPDSAIDILYGSGLIIDDALFVEAMILSDLEKSYQGLDIIEMTKEELDDLVQNSWWSDKFKIK